MDKLKELKEKKWKLDRQISNIEYKELVEKSVPLLRKSVGKCFKYLNSYGGDSKLWPLYIKIVEINDKDMTFETLEFQKTSKNQIEIRFENRSNFDGKNYFDDVWGSGSYIKITNAEFNRARKSLLKKVKELLKN